MKAKFAALSVFAMLLITSVIAVSKPATENEVSLEKPNFDPQPDSIKIWEAYAKGWVQINSVSDPSGSPSVFRVTNSGSLKVNINEMTMLLSPHPLQGGNPQTTQDGAMETTIIDPSTYVDFYYGLNTLPGAPYEGEMAWWCTEARQWTQWGATVMLGGEVMPDALQEFAKNPDYSTNDNIWNYLYLNPTLVVGKTPLWSNVEDGLVHNIDITVAVTNIAVHPGPGVTTPPHARNSIIQDVIPKDYSYVPGSIVPAPESVIENPDETTTITWRVDLDAADVSNHNELDPSPYNTQFLEYTLVTPKLRAGRYFLPRADADVNHDGEVDSHSARPLLEVYRVNKPPEPNAGGPYVTNEGSTTTLDASGSSDPNWDPLTFRWDLDADGAWDTGWSSSPFFAITCPDGPYETDIVLEVTDGEMGGTATTHYTCNNVEPTIETIAVQPSLVTEGMTFTIYVTFSDPGWPDTHTAQIDWRDGQTSTPAVTEENDEPDATGDFGDSHVYGDDFNLGIEITVTDDDDGVGVVDLPLDVLNVAPTADGFTYDLTVLEPRTQGYWRHQCTVTEPYGDHTGITEDLIQFVASNSQLFSYVSTAEDVCTALDWAAGEEMILRAQGQLMATWLNVASGKLEFSTGLRPPGQNETTLGDFLAWAESVIMGSSNRSELEYVKTIADEANNGNSIAIGEVSLSADVTDPGSDDMIISVDWGDSTIFSETYFNDGVSPDPPNSPFGTYPVSVHIEASHSYWAEGSYDLVITISDDDGGETLIHLTLDILAP